MSEFILDIPNQALLDLKVSATEASELLRLAAAMKFFELGRLSSGAAPAWPVSHELSF